MSAISPNTISSRITKPLSEVSQRQWTVLAARGVLQTLVASLAMLLAVSLLLGRFQELPVVARVALAVLGWGTVVWAAIHYLRPALHRWSMSRAARFAELSIPDSEERISSAVELSQADHAFRGSPELVAHLVKQAESDISRVKVADVVPFKTVFIWMLALVPVLALWTVLALNQSTAIIVLRGLFSTLTPWQVPPPVLADVAVKPGDQTLAQGDSLDIIAIVSAKDGKPARSANLVRTYATGQSTSESLTQVKGTEFTHTLENLQQSFKYTVQTDRGGSPTYNVTVRPRPEISRLDVRYDYPKYTGLDSKTQTASDGNIDAVVGTKITLTVAVSDSLVVDKSHLVFNDGQPDAANIALTPTANKNVYQASFPVARTGEYRFKLLNEYNLGSKNDDIRAVTAEIDQPPVIAIESPKEQITVRPDDEVAVMYVGGDDYGIATIQALVQVDDKPERTLPVTIHSRDRRNIKEQWTLSVPAMLRSAGVADATRISYQLKATDNRDPDPQTGLSTRQILLIDKNQKTSFQDTMREIQKEDLKAAIRKAIERLNQGGPRIVTMRDRANAVIAAETLKEVTVLRDYLSNTGKDLATASEDYLDTPFADIAKKAKEISETGIAGSADDIARYALDAGAASKAHTDAQNSYDKAMKARDDLTRLLDDIEKAEKKAEAAEELKQAAQEQAEIAKEMAEHPENVQQNQQKQQDAINKLQDALQKDPSLQNQQAQQLAQKVAELENKIQEDQQKQTDLQNQTAKQEEQQQAEKAANALAEQQKKLNQEVQQFAKDDKKPLDQAQAQTPDQKQQEQLVQNIEKNQLQNAAQEAQQAADQLKQDAQKLADQAKKPDAAPNADQQKQQQQDQQNAQDAQNAEKQADQAAQDLKNQAAQPQQNADANKQDAQKTADAAKAVEKAAEKVEQANQQGAKNADTQKEAEAAKADAQQAAQDAQAAAQDQNPQDAAKAEAKAAQELAQAGQELNQAAQAEAKADQAQAQQQNQQAAAQAADQAQALAQEQQQIAQALAQQAQQQADAQQNAQTPQQAAQAQQQDAQQTQQAQQAAQQLAQQANAQQDAQVAQRADQAAQALAEAAKDQQQAAQAEAAGKPDDAAQAQADAQHELAKAEEALHGNPEQAQANAEQGQPEQGHPEQGQPEQGHPEQGQGHPEQSAAQAAQEAAQAQQQALQPNPEAAADAAQALAQAAQAAQAGLPGQPEQGEPGQEPGEEPGMHPATVAEKASDPKMGMMAQDSGGNNTPPPSVVALGISANDWAKLDKKQQQGLLNASQQSSPAAYKEMIKNYYSRVARMQNDHPTAATKR